MNVTICDVCRKEMPKRGHVWAGALHVSDPMRNFSAEIKFMNAKGQEVDLCNEHMVAWMKAVLE